MHTIKLKALRLSIEVVAGVHCTRPLSCNFPLTFSDTQKTTSSCIWWLFRSSFFFSKYNRCSYFFSGVFFRCIHITHGTQQKKCSRKNCVQKQTHSPWGTSTRKCFCVLGKFSFFGKFLRFEVFFFVVLVFVHSFATLGTKGK